MGVYNAQNEPAFYDSIHSILTQTVKEFEFIICDDGSTDDTYNMLATIASTDKRILLIKNERNSGLAAALNQCILLASSDILIRQDIDDWSQNNRFELLLSAFQKKPTLAFIGSHCKLYRHNGIFGEMRYPEFPKNEDFLFGVPFTHGAVAMKRSAVLAVGGYQVSKSTRRTEDYELFMRFYANGFLGGNLQQSIYHYKEDASSKRKHLYRYRVDEALVRAKGFYSLGLLPKGIPYIIKPLIVGLIPQKLLSKLKDKYDNRRENY
ncbi:MAG: glycosyltransferase [Oscillospiraceae bacterium]